MSHSPKEGARELSGQVAIVLGASRGIGEAVAHSLAAAGAQVVLASRKLESLESVASAIRASGSESMAVACHSGREAEVRALVDKAIERFGKVDILVNNAATNPYFGPSLDVDWASWDKTFEVNLKGYFVATREVARHIQRRGGQGAVVNVASVAGLTGAPKQLVYGMSKAAVISMTKTLAVELAPQIRVNAVAPGWIRTRFAAAITETELVEPIVKRTPLGRVGTPQEVAGAVRLLASDAGSFFTGAVLTMDGGLTVT